MYVRGAKKHEEAWLLDRIDDLGLEDPAFRSREYEVAVDEESGSIAGFGRLRVHSDGSDECEVTVLGVLPSQREQGVGAHVLERLVEQAHDRGFEYVYTLTETGGYLSQFGFERIETADLPEKLAQRLEEIHENGREGADPYRLHVEDFSVPARLRSRFKRAGDSIEETDDGETPEDFGIDPDSATYKYDTGQ